MYKNIIGFDNYKINEFGEVVNIKTNKILKPSPCGKGYLKLTLCKNGKCYGKYIHQLVAETFIGKVDGLIVNHIDGNKLNNHYSNLEYCTYSQNNYHAYNTNLKPKGENFYNSKLTKEQVIQIRKEYTKNHTFQDFANKYNVSRATIRDVILYKTWKHI